MTEQLKEKALALGAYRAEMVKVEDIALDPYFRKMCESNACGNYGRSYMCPPDIGGIEELMERFRTYELALVYQTVGKLEDSFDFEGMMEAAEGHNRLAQKLWDYTDELQDISAASGATALAAAEGLPDASALEFLHLGAGGCRLCSVCGKKMGTPCAHPDRAMGSLEAYGVNVSELAKLAGMGYINGQNTVTYFGCVLIRRG